MPGEMDRKKFLKRGWMRLLLPLLAEAEEDEWLPPRDRAGERPLLRPPGAIPEPDFLSTCHRCGTCVEACPADAIRFAEEGEGLAAGTPIIVAAAAPCVVCDALACMANCPSGALRLVPKESIRMGVARVEPDNCLAWNGADPGCRACVEMCPFAGSAISVEAERGPVVHEAACTGCGLCEFYCPAGKTAILVEPIPRVS